MPGAPVVRSYPWISPDRVLLIGDGGSRVIVVNVGVNERSFMHKISAWMTGLFQWGIDK